MNSEIKIGKTFDRRDTCIQFRNIFCQINKFITNINEERKIRKLTDKANLGFVKIVQY